MKKLINMPENVESEMLEGMIKAHPEYITKHQDFNILLRSGKKQNKVALVSGGGSGHEPAHGGYVGYGMLDAAVAGAVFTSPTPDQVFEAIKSVDVGKGVLLIIKNYSGDIMNFEMAAELAEMEGIRVEKVIVNDDVAVEDSLYTAGRRGVAGTIFVHKISGALAEEGASLEEVKEVAEKVIANVRTMGVALSPCIVPAAGKSGFNLNENEIEMGIGIHGEPGIHREALKSADEITFDLMEAILNDMNLASGDDVAVMVNGLGSTPLMELYIVNRKINEVLDNKNIKVCKTYVGNYMTAIEMSGCSITLLKLDNQLKTLLNEKVDTIAFK